MQAWVFSAMIWNSELAMSFLKMSDGFLRAWHYFTSWIAFKKIGTEKRFLSQRYPTRFDYGSR